MNTFKTTLMGDDDGKYELKFGDFAFGFDTIEARKVYLSQHPELLSEPCLAAVDALIARMKAEGFTKLTQHRLMRTILRRVAEVGIDEAFTEFVISSDSVIAAVNAVMKARNRSELSAVVINHHKALDTKDAVSAFHFLRAQHADDKKRLANINARWEAIDMALHDKLSTVTSEPVVRTILEDQTVRWSTKPGHAIIWAAPKSFFTADKPEGWTIRDFWCLREGDSVTVTNRWEDLPPWFSLYPSEVANELCDEMTRRLNAGYKPTAPMEGSNIWRVKAGERLVLIDTTSTTQPVIEILDLESSVLALGENENPTFEGITTFGAPWTTEMDPAITRLFRYGFQRAVKLGAPSVFAEDWALGG